MQAFETAEFQSRVESVRALMEEAGLDALLLSSPGNMCYLTGYDAWSSYVPQAALITQNDDPYLVLRSMDMFNTDGIVWVGEDHVLRYDESYIGASDRNPWTGIGELVKSKLAPHARLGAELSGAGLGVADHRYLSDALQLSAPIEDVSGLVARCKRVKSEQELTYITEAATIADAALLAGVNKIAVGTRQADVAAAVMAVQCSGANGIPGGPPLEPVTMPTGSIANAPHLKWSDGTFDVNQQTNFEVGAFRHRYAGAVSRTSYLGTAPQRLQDIHAAVREAFLAAEQALRPGQLCSAVSAASQAALGRHGLNKASRFGYSIGIDWGDGGASLAAWDNSEIVPMMAIHVIIGIWEREEGYVFSETFRTTDNSATSLSSLPRELFEISV